MKNLPIIVKFLLVMAAFGLFSLASTTYATSQMQGISAGYRQLIDGDGAAALAGARANRSLQTAMGSIGNLMMADTDAGNQAAMATLNSAKASFVSYMDKAAAADPGELGTLQTLKANGLQVIEGDCGHSIQLGLAANDPATNGVAQLSYLNECQPNLPPLTAAFVAEVTHMQTIEAADEARLATATDNTVLTTFAILLAGLAAVKAGGFFIIRKSVATPIAALQTVMDRLAKGDLDARLADDGRRDEIGRMAAAVRVFKEAGLEKRRLEEQTARDRATAEAASRQAAAVLEAFAVEQETVVTALGLGLERLAQGDLQFRLTQEFNQTYEKLRTDFNVAIGTLHETMKSITRNAHGVKTGATEINRASDDLSRRTEQQAAALEETAAALDEITATVKRSADGAKQARDLAANAKADAERSGEVVRDMVGAMNGIETSSKQIGNIISVIDEIAFQTNLLALNAGVEAARAGDAGRGFAVVATEVRALAQRSAEAAKEIKTLISASGEQVEGGVKLVGETGKTLARIAEQVAQLNAVVADIAASAQEQATGLTEVNTAINQMDQVTQRNAAMVEETTAASNTLASEAQQLAQLVARFKIGGAPAAPPPRRSAPSPAPAPKKPAATGQNTVSELAASTKRAAGGGGVAESSQDWSEF
jgi:methyl-accepting chemotaxis protein